MKLNYLKCYDVIRRFIMYKHGISTKADLEMLIFIYDEGIFAYKNIKDFMKVMPWDKKRFARLIEQKFIDVVRESDGERFSKTPRLYMLSKLGRKAIRDLYATMEGKLPNDTSSYMLKKNIEYNERMARGYIKHIRDKTKELQQHQTPE